MSTNTKTWYLASHLLRRRCQQSLRACNSVSCRHQHATSCFSDVPRQHPWPSTFPSALLCPGKIVTSDTLPGAIRHSNRGRCVGTSMYHVFIGYENNPVSRSRKQLLDPSLFAVTIPRCYLYSKSDALVAWKDIYEHGSDLIKRHGCVTESIFEDSEHVSHAKTEPKQYWDTVRTVWIHSQEIHKDIDTKPTHRNPHISEPLCRRDHHRSRPSSGGNARKNSSRVRD
jgi:hypothetical protein